MIRQHINSLYLRIMVTVPGQSEGAAVLIFPLKLGGPDLADGGSRIGSEESLTDFFQF